MRPSTERGWLEVITGCMFSGKTEELLARLRQADQADKNIIAFTPETDDRYEELSDKEHNNEQDEVRYGVIGSHIGRSWDAIKVNPDNPDEIFSYLNDEEDIVAVDEANFFSDDLISVCNELADDNYRVIVSGTDQTFRGEPFSPLPGLMATAEYVQKQPRAVCEQCGQPASRNQRLINGEPAPMDAPTIQVGADELYEARCRDCHTVPESDE